MGRGHPLAARFVSVRLLQFAPILGDRGAYATVTRVVRSAARRRSDVSLHVQREVVAAREGALATRTLERPVAGVLAVVARQLVGPRELPRARRPRAAVRLLAGVRAQVRLQVRTPCTLR